MTYIIPETPIIKNRAFKTSARPIYLDTCLDKILKEGFLKMLEEQEQYDNVGSCYTLDKIDGLLLSVNKFRPNHRTFSCQKKYKIKKQL